MPAPALLLLLATLSPLIGFLLLMAIGRRLGAPLAGWAGTFFVCLSFGFSLWAMVVWYDPSGGHYRGVEWAMGRHPILLTAGWPGAKNWRHDVAGPFDLALYLDSLTIALFSTITVAASLAHLFAVGFMRGDEHYSRFFARLNLLCFSVLGLVLSGTLIQITAMWEILAVASFLLVRFRAHDPAARRAARKVFIVGRLADIGLLVAIVILLKHLSDLTLPGLWSALGDAGGGGAVSLPGGRVLSAGLLSFLGSAIFCAVAAAAAQFPLHVWLADSTKAPAPAIAMIFSLGLILAGVYLLARVFPLLTPDARMGIALAGVTSMLIGSIASIAQDDLVQVVAYSTMSQAGLMVVAMGLGSWIGGLFHLITHAFFGALLLLAVGSVIWAVHGRRQMSRLGGLWRRAPWTALAMAIGVFAAAGAQGLSGYYSRAMILDDAGAFATLATRFGGRSAAYGLFFILPAFATFLTAFALARAWNLTFIGSAREATAGARSKETPILWSPLLALAGISIFAGTMLGVPNLLRASLQESKAICREARGREGYSANPDVAGFAQIWPADSPTHVLGGVDPADAIADSPAADYTPAAYAHDHGRALRALSPVRWSWLLGILLAAAIYGRGYAVASPMMRFPPMRWMRVWLANGMFLDIPYELLVVRGPRAMLMGVSATGRLLAGRLAKALGRGSRLPRA